MQYFTPIKIFVIGQLFLLITFPFFPAIGTAATNLAADPASVTYATYGWGWSWLMSTGVVKWLVYVGLEGAILVSTFLAYWHIKTR